MTASREQPPRKDGLAASLRGSLSGTEFRYLFRFLVVGLLNTCVGLGTIFACKYFFSLADVPANVIGYLVGLTNSFFWNRSWTFAHSGENVGTAVRFVMVFAVAYSANLLLLMSLLAQLRISSYVAQALANVLYTAVFYLGSRYFVFVRGPAAQRQ
jgi:putative flippase GtrA